MKRSNAGFTLLEAMVVAVIVLLLAGMLVPNLESTVDDAEETAIRQQLGRLRQSTEFYAFQHQDLQPGEDAGGVWSAATFEDQLLLASDIDGNTAPAGTPGFPYGPYLTDGMPENPYNGLSTVTLVPPGGAFLAPDGTTGWVFFADDGTIRANTGGTAVSGHNIFEL